ncbi:hypothetical protein N9772_03225 [Bacteroidia bacterium]|nr:hypothetical protein [Bacteroidia bacterium]
MRSFLFILVIGVLTFSSCDEQPVKVIPESSRSTENAILVISEVISTFDVVEDFVSGSEMFFKQLECLLPEDAEVRIIDGDFEDGDGVEILIDFGVMGLEPCGLLCKDNKYRAGKICITLDKPYAEPDAILTVSFSETHPFYSGSGKEMNKIEGEFVLHRISEDQLLLCCSELIITTVGNDAVSLHGDLTITRIDNNGIGLIGDKLTFDGALGVLSDSDELIFDIVEPLHKAYDLSCAQYIKKGKMEVDPMNSASIISVDFDPNNDSSCDHTVGITVNGRMFIYMY